jgi:PIN domain nuclease of toxin-antitoxin system
MGEELKRGPLHASAISLLEIATAVRRGRLALKVPAESWLDDLCLLPELRLEAVTGSIARRAGFLGDPLPGDPVDRLIVATAQVLGATLITADAGLRKSAEVQSLW